MDPKYGDSDGLCIAINAQCALDRRNCGLEHWQACAAKWIDQYGASATRFRPGNVYVSCGTWVCVICAACRVATVSGETPRYPRICQSQSVISGDHNLRAHRQIVRSPKIYSSMTPHHSFGARFALIARTQHCFLGDFLL
jgi:hypothetical protein